MRKLIPIALTLAALVGAFVAYFALQGKYGVNANDTKTVDSFPSQTMDNPGIIKPGSGAWSKQYDKQGNLYYQFRCDYYDPQPDGNVKVTHPVIQFFLSRGQLLQIEGANGSIRFAQAANSGALTNPPSDPPRYGNLQHVTVKLFSTVDRQHADDPDMTMQMLNAQFDDDTYRLFTEEYVDDTGKVHHADEIPVTVKSPDYSFDGSGLVLFWNDLDKQLKSLDIAHGKDLTLYGTSGFLADSPKSASPNNQGTEPAPVQPSSPSTPPIELPPTETQPESTRQRYTATFFDNLRIEQADNLIEAKEMEIDFATRGGSSAGGSSPAPTSAPAPVSTPTTSPTPAPSTAPATHPSAQPIHIRWTGPMHMVPTDPTNAPPLPGGKAIVRLMGTPVKIHEVNPQASQRVDLQCNNLEYHTDDSSAHLLGNVLITQTKADGPASTIASQSLEFSRLTHIARFLGPGETRFPDPNDPKSILKSAWRESCTIHLYDTAENQTAIEMADLEGGVAVDDESRFHLTADKNLQLRFDRLEGTDTSASSAPPLRLISANGNVQCNLTEANQQTRHISGEHLQLFRDRAPDGKLYARTIECNGNVHAQTEDQSLSAEGLQVDLTPAKPGAIHKPDANAQAPGLDAGDVSLDRLVASNNVVITGKDGAAANADDLVIQMTDDHAHITLDGSAKKPAMVRNKTSSITGWTIHLSPHDQKADIDGAGTFDGITQPKNPGEKSRPMHLTWSKAATLDGIANQVIVDGDVSAASDDHDGGQQSADCARIVAKLIDVAPATEPSTKPAKEESYTDGADFMKNKQVASISLQAPPTDPNATTQPNAKVESIETDANGNLTRQYDLLTHTTIDYDMLSKRLSVIGPGQIFAREIPPATTQPAANSGSAIGGQGDTAIGWKKRFIYDETKNAAVIEGEVVVVHTGNGPKSESVRLENASIIQAEFEAAPETSPAPGAPPAAPKLKQVTAVGSMVIHTADKTITCGEIDFDPVNQLLTCTPGELANVIVVDNNNLDRGSCSEAVFNMKTNELKKLTDVTGQGR